MPDRMSAYMSDRMPDRMSEYMSDRIPEYMSDRMAYRMPDRVSECLPDRMTDRMSEYMSDICQTECQNICHTESMVGITGGKVFFLVGWANLLVFKIFQRSETTIPYLFWVALRSLQNGF